MSGLSRSQAPQTSAPQVESGGKTSGGSSRSMMGNSALLALFGLDSLKKLVGGQPEGPGTVVANPDPESEHVKGATYTDVKGSPFIQGKGDAGPVAANDVNQGQLGDCYFVAALAAIAHTRPDIIQKKITNNNDGTYTVHFHEGGDVMVDGKFATKGGSVQFAGEGDRTEADGAELWVMLIEKAWAALKGGYEKIRGSKVRMSSDDAMEAVTGAATKTLRPSGMAEDDILKALDEAKTKKWPATLGVRNVTDAEEIKAVKATGLVPNHAFAVLDVDAKGKTVTAYNPWGAEYKVPPLSPATIKKFVDSIHINQIKQ